VTGITERIAITGGTGFIGHVLCARLADAGYGVHSWGRRPPTVRNIAFHPHDLLTAKPPSFPESLEAVIHTSGIAETTSHTVEDFERLNVIGSRLVAQAAADAGAKSLVFLSSVKAISDATPEDGHDDSTICAPTTPYGRSKLRAEEAISEALQGSGTRLTILRLTPVYGPGCKGGIRKLVYASKMPFSPRTPVGVGFRSMVHVFDLAALVESTIQYELAGSFIVEDGKQYGTREIQDTVASLSARTQVRILIPRWAINLELALSERSIPQYATRRRKYQYAIDRFVKHSLYHGTKLRATGMFHPQFTLWDYLPTLLRP
jgi:nucleoside-diphosphate-sugar epimerase